MRKPAFSNRAWMVPLSVVASLLLAGQAPVPEPITDQETELGDAVYKELKNRAEIIAASPLYDVLSPLAAGIVRVAQPRYQHSLKFVLVHESQPNAFSVPGGNVYVTDALLHFVRNTEELAGTLCHEVSHTIHRDAINRLKASEKRVAIEIGAAILLGPTLAQALAIAVLGDLQSNAYSRDLETTADITGSDICAAANYNPHGLIWLFQDFENADTKQVPQLLADHPANNTRIRDLQKHFRENPEVFSRFSPDRKLARPLNVPEDAPVTFLRR
jgi:predicted Zn-dependent protease